MRLVYPVIFTPTNDEKDTYLVDIPDIDPSEGRFADVGPSTVSLVDIDIDEYRRKMDNRTVRKNVSIPAWMDAAAKEAHLNVSRVLQEALTEKLEALG